LVNLEKNAGPTEFILRAETPGKKTVDKKFTVTIDLAAAADGKCAFSVTPFKGETVFSYFRPDEVGAENVRKRSFNEANAAKI